MIKGTMVKGRFVVLLRHYERRLWHSL